MCPSKVVWSETKTSHMVQQQEDSAEESAMTVAVEAKLGESYVNKFESIGFNSACIVRSLSKPQVLVKALVETGSPINLICRSTYAKYFANKELFRVKNTVSLKGANESVITVLGKIYDHVRNVKWSVV